MDNLCAKHHGFHCTVLFGINEEGLVDPTMPVSPKKREENAFKSHHIPEMKDHPILIGVRDIWGPSDVYRTYKEGSGLPDDCIALVMGQPLIGRKQGGANNPEKAPLPVVWFKHWKTSKGIQARVIQSTMGSGKDLQNPGLRRLIINATYWGLEMENQISAESSVAYTKPYKPLDSGFNYKTLGVLPHPPVFYRQPTPDLIHLPLVKKHPIGRC